MKILVVALELPFPPHPGGGDRLRLYYLTKYLAKKHTLTIVAPVSGDSEEAIRRTRELGIEVKTIKRPSHRFLMFKLLPALFSRRPFAFATPTSRTLRRKVLQVLGEGDYDVVYLHSWTAGAFLDAVLPEGRTRPCVLSPSDATSSLFQQLARGAPSFFERFYHRLEAPRVRWHEAMDYPKATKCIVLTEEDREELLHISPGMDASEGIPNGVDTEFFKPGDTTSDFPSLIFTGVMGWTPNADAVLYFYNKILPLIRNTFPSVRFYVVGASPTGSVQALSQDKNVVVTGFVPDVRPYLQRATVYVCPLRMGWGIKNKVLEAMAMEKPVVGTPLSYAGIRASFGENAFVVSEPAEFADIVVKLLGDEGLRRKIGENARRLVETDYSWERIAQRYEKVFIEAVNKSERLQG